jgi:hypothetical protein
VLVRPDDIESSLAASTTTPVTTAGQVARPESNLPADREPRTAADTTEPTRASRVERSSVTTRANRRNGTDHRGRGATFDLLARDVGHDSHRSAVSPVGFPHPSAA